jgi:hypothetical protein
MPKCLPHSLFGTVVLAVAFAVALPCAGFADEPEPQPKRYKRLDQTEEAEEELMLPDEYLMRDWTTPPPEGRRFSVGEGDSIEDGYLDEDEREELELYRIQEGERPDPFDVFREAPIEPEEEPEESVERAFDETYDDPAEW